MEKLTLSQLNTLLIIKAYIKAHGYAPSRRDLALELEVTPNAVTDSLIILERKGFISVAKKKARGIIVKKGKRNEKYKQNN